MRAMRKERFIAEAIGTFSLLLMGCGAIVVDQQFGGIGHLGVALAFGLVVMAMIYTVGNISGAHLNPAVSLGFWAAGRLAPSALPGYLLAQTTGALVAVGLLRALFPDAESLGQTVPTVSAPGAFGVELVMSFILMFVILNVATGHKETGIMAGVAVGGTIMLEALVAGPLTGASMNPARSLAPALWSGDLGGLWIYLTAPIAGALLAAPLCRLVQGPECCVGEDA